MELAQNLEWTHVDSSNVDAVAHDAENSDLYVRFKSGSVYCYHKAVNAVFVDLVHAPSVGKYLNAHIKPYFDYELISP